MVHVVSLALSVIGTGYLGAVHAVCMAHLGHTVVGVDTDAARVQALAAGRSPLFEPGLDELLVETLATGRLTFTTDIERAAGADVHFLCVGTPQARGERRADLTHVYAAADALAPHVAPGALVVGKSTVPVATAERLVRRMQGLAAADVRIEVVWNPEFLREGFAIADTLTPDRIVYGVAEPGSAGAAAAVARLDEVYAAALASGVPRIVTDHATAELVKVAANAFLATKISFINAMAEISETVGADVTRLAAALGHDERIGHRYLGAGIGFGGGCLPKDIRAFAARAEELGRRDSVAFLREVDAINLRRRERAAQLVVEALEGAPLGKKVAVLGAAFKPFTDDTRDSPALEVATRLHGLGAEVVVTDPKAIPNARRQHPQLGYEQELDRALHGADAVLVVTEWNEYRRELSPEHAGSLVKTKTVVDGRNCLDPAIWRAAGWEYRGMGRP